MPIDLVERSLQTSLIHVTLPYLQTFRKILIMNMNCESRNNRIIPPSEPGSISGRVLKTSHPYSSWITTKIIIRGYDEENVLKVRLNPKPKALKPALLSCTTCHALA